MKNILKSFGAGVLFVAMSYFAFAFGALAVGAFTATAAAVGLEAVGLLFAGLALGAMTLFTIFYMGAIPLSTIEDLKSKLKEKEND